MIYNVFEENYKVSKKAAKNIKKIPNEISIRKSLIKVLFVSFFNS